MIDFAPRHRLAGIVLGAMLWVLYVPMAAAVGELREWTDVEGRSFEGRLIASSGESVRIQRERDMRHFNVPLARLGDPDRSYVEKKIEDGAVDPIPPPPSRDSDQPLQDQRFRVTEGLRWAVAPALDPRLGPDGRELPALRWYPSAHLPPVSEPYIFHYYATAPTGRGELAYNSKRTKATELAQDGILPLKWHWGPQNPHVEEARDQRDAYLRRMRGLLPPQHPYYLDRSWRPGIAVDEWQKPKNDVEKGHPLHPENPYGLSGSIQGMLDAKALAPEFFIAVYWRGQPNIRPALEHGAVDLLIIEGALLKRGERAREMGYADRTIFMHGYLNGSDDLETVEKRIRTMRERFPEMPGMAIYTGGGTPATYRDKNPQWLRKFDALLLKHFVRPAPEVRFTAPRFETRIDESRIRLEAEASGRDGRAIQKYRWFVDNRLVSETDEPLFEWDTTHEWPGRHTLTIHAVDENWNRAAAQIPIRLMREPENRLGQQP